MPAFTLKLDDPAGNSWIEFVGSMADPKWNMRTYARTFQQNVDLGLVAAPEVQPLASLQEEEQDASGQIVEAVDEEIYVFHGVCSSCGHPLDTMMKKVLIPYFKVCPKNAVNFGWCLTRPRMSLSCPPTATDAATETTRSSLALRSRSKGNGSLLKLRIARTLAGTF
jgi:hypothetical protein